MLPVLFPVPPWVPLLGEFVLLRLPAQEGAH